MGCTVLWQGRASAGPGEDHAAPVRRPGPAGRGQAGTGPPVRGPAGHPLERSRSGCGGHLWLFFDEAIPASLARQLGSHILTETMEHRPEIGLGSYDRLFPNQDTLPKGGFGNLIALPLQKRASQKIYSLGLFGIYGQETA